MSFIRRGELVGSEKTDANREGVISVLASSEFKDLISGIIDNWKQEIQVMLQALDRNNYEAIRSISHKMRGTGAMLGFGDITEMGEILETAAANRNKERIRETLQMLSAHIVKMDVEY